MTSEGRVCLGLVDVKRYWSVTLVATLVTTKAYDQDYIRYYMVSHNYGNPWFLLYSFWINRHKVIKF